MKKSAFLSLALATFISSAAHASFLPNSGTYRYDVDDKSISETSIFTRYHSIELTPTTPHSNPILANQWCTTMKTNAKLPQIKDRDGLFSNLVIYSELVPPMDYRCFLRVPANMGDAEFTVELNNGGKQSILNFVYRDITPISASRLVTENFETRFESLPASVDEGEYVDIHVFKDYGNLAFEGALPKGLEIHRTRSNSSNDIVSMRIYGKAIEAGDFNFSITDLNSDNKKITHRMSVAALPEEKEDEEKGGCQMTAPANGQKIIFRFQMKTVGSKC